MAATEREALRLDATERWALDGYEIHDPSCRARGRLGPCSHCNRIDAQRALDLVAVLAEYEG